MDRTGIPDIDIEHAKYSSIMPVTNGKQPIAIYAGESDGSTGYRIQSTPQNRAILATTRSFARYGPNKVPV